MRIAQVIGSLDPDMGGLPKAVVSLSAALSAGDDEVAVFFQAHPRDLPRIEAAYADLPGYEKIIKTVLPPTKIPFSGAGDLRRALRAFSPEIIHTHGLWEPMLNRAQRYALAAGIPFGLCAHSMLHPWQAGHHTAAKWMLKYVLGWKSIWDKAAFVQVLNADEAGHGSDQGLSQTRLIPNGIFPEEDMGGGDPVFPEFGSRPFVLSLARLHAQKAPDVLLDAFALLATTDPDLQLVLAGPDYGMRSELLRQVRTAGLESRVQLPGPLSGKQKWAALHQCACFCLPSRAEGFSMALLEAGLAGAPCVISEACYFPALVEAGGALQAPLEAKGLAEVLRRGVDDPGDMGKKAQALVLGHYQWRGIVEKLRAVYAEALSSRNCRRT